MRASADAGIVNEPSLASALICATTCSGLPVGSLEQEALEVRGHLNVHRRRLSRLDRLRRIASGRQRAHENVVLVGRDDQTLDRQSHALGVIAGQHVAEIAGRNGEGYWPLGRAKRNGGDEIIDDLRQDPRPIDGIDARQAHFVAKSEIAEQFLDDALTIVERALNRERVDVGPIDRRHLPALHVRHPALRVEDEHFDLGLLGESLDRRGAGVARGRANDRRPGAARPQNAIHRLAQPLHGEILERQRRSVEKFEREQVVVDLRERRNRGVTEARIGGRGQRVHFVRIEILARRRAP